METLRGQRNSLPTRQKYSPSSGHTYAGGQKLVGSADRCDLDQVAGQKERSCGQSRPRYGYARERG